MLFTRGESVVDYLDAFDVDFFLATMVKDGQKVIDSKSCAATVLKELPENGYLNHNGSIYS